MLPLVSGPVKLIALALAATAATPLTVLPKPRFNAPAHAPEASRVHFVLVGSRPVAIVSDRMSVTPTVHTK